MLHICPELARIIHGRVRLLSRTGAGVDYLQDAINIYIKQHITAHRLTLPMTAGQLRAKLFDMGAVRYEDVNQQGGWTMEIELEDFKFIKLGEEARLDIFKVAVRVCGLLRLRTA